MKLRKACQILKTFADDTRLRIINLLNRDVLNVAELCKILQKNQSNISKHLSKLRLTGIVNDKREGVNIFYHLIEPKEKAYKELLGSVTAGLAGLEAFKQDLGRLRKLKNKQRQR